MKAADHDISDENCSDSLPLILLSGDNARTAGNLYRVLIQHGFRVQLAAAYQELAAVWERERYPIILLEISGAHGVEAAVNAAIELKRQDPGQFVGYLADPFLSSSGLAGDGIFPRSSERLVKALQICFLVEAPG